MVKRARTEHPLVHRDESLCLSQLAAIWAAQGTHSLHVSGPRNPIRPSYSETEWA